MSNLWKSNWGTFYSTERDAALLGTLGTDETVQIQVETSKTKGSEFGASAAAAPSLSGKENKSTTSMSGETIAVHSGRDAREAGYARIANNNAYAIQQLQKTNLMEPKSSNGRITLVSRPISAAEAESLVKFQNTIQITAASRLAQAAVNAIPK